jgi:hypothetical protein
VPKDVLQKAVDKVGNSATAVRKELTNLSTRPIKIRAVASREISQP